MSTVRSQFNIQMSNLSLASRNRPQLEFSLLVSGTTRSRPPVLELAAVPSLVQVLQLRISKREHDAQLELLCTQMGRILAKLHFIFTLQH